MSAHPVGAPVPGWTARPVADAVALTGRHVALEPLGPEHIGPLWEALGGPEATDLFVYRPHEQPGSREAMGALVAEILAAPGMATMAVVPTDDVACGLVSFMRVEPAHGQAEIAGVLYAPRLQRTVASTETTHLLAGHVFDTLGYRRLEWKCDSLNEPSRRAALRLGFTFEGTFRQHLVVKGRNRDTAWFSITDGEWPAIRAAHRAWLDPANHDADGGQRRSLASLLPGAAEAVGT